MNKPDTVPAEAVWDENSEQWQLGTYNADGKKAGIWKCWHVNGYCTSTEYNDDTSPLKHTCFHSDGTIAIEIFYGPVLKACFTRSENPTRMGFPIEAPAVWRFEAESIDNDIIIAKRYYNKANEPVSDIGTPLPKRPAGVPEQAYFTDESGQIHGSSGWIQEQYHALLKRNVGEYLKWDIDGLLLHRCIFDKEYEEPIENYLYKQGKLYQSRIFETRDRYITSYYHDNGKVKESQLQTNNYSDKLYTYFDQTGKTLFTVFDERISPDHDRRHYNGILVYEGDLTNVNYYYPDGTVMLHYTFNGNGTGYWTLYEQDGSISVTWAIEREKDYYRGDFLTWPPHFDLNVITPEWELIKATFNKQYTAAMFKQQLAALPIPSFLKKAITKLRWDVVEELQEDIPLYFLGLFADDAAIAANAQTRLWNELTTRDGYIFPVTYQVANMIIKFQPKFPNIKERLHTYLQEIIAIPDLDKKLITTN